MSELLVSPLSSWSEWERAGRQARTTEEGQSGAEVSVHWGVAPGGEVTPQCLPRRCSGHPSPTQEPLLAPLGPHLAIYVGFGPGDVVVVVDDHGPAEHVQVFHHVLLGICQCGDLRVVAWSGRGWLLHRF